MVCLPRTKTLLLGSAKRIDHRGGVPGLLGDQAILRFDLGASRLVAIQSTEDFAGNPTVGTLGAILIEHIEKDNFTPGGWLFGHQTTPTSATPESESRIPKTDVK